MNTQRTHNPTINEPTHFSHTRAAVGLEIAYEMVIRVRSGFERWRDGLRIRFGFGLVVLCDFGLGLGVNGLRR